MKDHPSYNYTSNQDQSDGAIANECKSFNRDRLICPARNGRSGGTLVHRRTSSGDRGLYVSTGGFTKEARYEADRATIPIRLLDLDSFVRHYVEVYDKADEETRSILPLTRIWWPA